MKIQMNWNLGNDISRYGNIYGTMFYYLVRETIDRFGDAGEEAARMAASEYGYFRGRLLRKEQESHGYEINLANFNIYYDLPRDPRTHGTDKKKIDPNAREFRQVGTTCQYSDMWKYLSDEDEDSCNLVGQVYCEQFHPAMWTGYDARLLVDIETFIAQGDKDCRFWTYTSHNTRMVPVYMPKAAETFDWHFENKRMVMSNITTFVYFFMVREVMTRFPEEGEDCIRAAMEKYGQLRGKLTAQWHTDEGLELTLENLFHHYDAAEEVGKYKVEGKKVCVCDGCRFCDVCNVMEETPLRKSGIAAGLFCDTYYKGLVKGYNPALGEAKVEKSIAAGDDSCLIVVD